MASVPYLRIGHRGAAGAAPPGNTLASIAAALRTGVDLVEVDIQQTRDGQLIVLHDSLLQPSTTGRGYVNQRSLDEVRRLRTVPGDQPIPALADVLEAVNGHAGLMLEIKQPGTARNLLDTVRASGFQGPVYYASFLHAELRALRSWDPAARTIALLDGAPIDAAAFAVQAQATHAGISMSSLSPDFARALHQAGLGVLVWTADEREEIAFARQCGVDGIISNYPERLVS